MRRTKKQPKVERREHRPRPTRTDPIDTHSGEAPRDRLARRSAIAAVAAIALGATTSANAAQMEFGAWVLNPTWGTERALVLTYNGPHTDGDRVWVMRDRRLGACPATPTDARHADVRWLLGRPAAGLPARALFAMDRTRAIRRGERGRIRVCAWLRQEGAPTPDGNPTATWSRARRYFTLRRVIPTPRERSLGVRQIRAEMYRSSRVWHRLGYRTRTVGPKFSRIDPTFALVEVTRATRADMVQPALTIYHLSAGRWHRLQGLAGDIDGMWCDEDGGSAGQVPLLVLRGFFGARICRGRSGTSD